MEGGGFSRRTPVGVTGSRRACLAISRSPLGAAHRALEPPHKEMFVSSLPGTALGQGLPPSPLSPPRPPPSQLRRLDPGGTALRPGTGICTRRGWLPAWSSHCAASPRGHPAWLQACPPPLPFKANGLGCLASGRECVCVCVCQSRTLLGTASLGSLEPAQQGGRGQGLRTPTAVVQGLLRGLDTQPLP